MGTLPGEGALRELPRIQMEDGEASTSADPAGDEPNPTAPMPRRAAREACEAATMHRPGILVPLIIIIKMIFLELELVTKGGV